VALKRAQRRRTASNFLENSATDRGIARLMTIFAHPDDETFGLAGTLRRATSAGHAAAVVCATRGEAGQIADPSLATKETLGAVRERELRNAMEEVGVRDARFLDYQDGRLPEVDHEEAVEKITRHIRAFRPDLVVTFPANGGYGHVDHIAIHHLTLDALRAAADEARFPEQGLAPHRIRKRYFVAFSRERMVKMQEEAAREGRDYRPGGDAATIPFEEMGVPEAEITTRIILSDDEFAAKLRAVHSHKTQLRVDGPWMTLAPDALRAFLGVESFQLVPELSDRQYTAPEEDLFAGL
jgi:LmbE family N-acetylglucosaminyl deacetylase